MSDFDKILERFGDHKENLKELGDVMVERYPQSKNLVALSEELATAIDGLDALQERLGKAIQEAEQQAALKVDIESQMAKSSLYERLSDRDKRKLSEYLMQNGVGLASDEELKSFMSKSLEQKSDEELLSEFSKPFILELGKSQNQDMQEFDAYREGLSLLKNKISDSTQKKELVDALATDIMNQTPETAVKLFYSKAYQPVSNEVPAS